MGSETGSSPSSAPAIATAAAASSSSATSSPTGTGKRNRDPEDEVYVDNLHSHKRYLSEVLPLLKIYSFYVVEMCMWN